MSFIKIPSIEEIYNEYHKQLWFSLHGYYPRSIKNFEKVLKDTSKVEFLTRFQNMLKRNGGLIDWKIYIKANAEILKGRFNLKILGSLGATKIYTNYLACHNLSDNNEDEIYNEIIKSLQFLVAFLKENNLTFIDYLLVDNDLVPLALKHLYSGTISYYFYAAFSGYTLNHFFITYHDDVFFELFEMNKYDFINTVLLTRRTDILKFQKIFDLANKLELKFSVNNNKEN